MKIKMRKILALLCAVTAFVAMFGMTACDFSSSGTPTPTPTPTPSDPLLPSVTPEQSEDPTYEIKLNGNSATTTASEGVKISGSTITISKPAIYEFSGSLSDGNVIVSVAKTEKVTIVLAGVNISSSTTAPFYITSCDKVTFKLKSGTENVLSDASKYVYEGNATKPNACIYSKDDLIIKGDGSLKVIGNYNNGIGSKNDLRIKGGNITVSAKNNALKGNDSVEITGGIVNITGCDDAVKTDNTEEVTKGFINVENATVNIVADDDGFVANTKITVKKTAKVTFRTLGDGVQYKCATGVLDIEQ